MDAVDNQRYVTWRRAVRRALRRHFVRTTGLGGACGSGERRERSAAPGGGGVDDGEDVTTDDDCHIST